MYPNEPPSLFTRNKLFVYFAEYKVPSRGDAYGELKHLLVSCLSSTDWREPDQTTINSFKAKISEDIWKAMTPGRISGRLSQRQQFLANLHPPRV